MSRKRIHAEGILSGAEKQKRYREKRRAALQELEALKAASIAEPAPATLPAPDMAAIREQIKKELRETWEPEILAEKKAAARKQGRENEKRADQNFAHGRITGICAAAACMAGIDRADIARFILSHFMIDREKAAAVLEADKRTSNMTLAALDKYKAWGKPPKVIK